jgi:hypothetical protein
MFAESTFHKTDLVPRAKHHYHELYQPHVVVKQWPVFAKDLDALGITDVDANSSDDAWRNRGTY